MSQACSVCKHKDAAAIGKMIVDGVPLRRIAEQSGTSVTALHRHKAHIPAALATAKQAEQAADAATLLQQVQELLQQARRLTNAAEHAKDLRTALNDVRAVATTLGLLGQVSGELKSSMSVTTNILVALKGLDDGQVKQTLLDAGHAGWYRVNPSKPAANEQRVLELGARLLRNLDDDEFKQVLIASGKGAAFLPAGKPN